METCGNCGGNEQLWKFCAASTGVVKCPMTWVYWTSPKIVAIINYIPNGWVMFNGDI